ncbi:MAG TPA: histidinol dehydrogenase [Acidimicrobiales bacterium]|jgi:histidinol dehydrogenase|nr:histidinol dehydrogenase [Acidimicrobiales bacterium]
MLTRLDLRGVTDLVGILPRPAMAKEPPTDAVEAILADVRARGDTAVREHTERLDRVVLDDLRVPAGELGHALESIPTPLREALEAAQSAIGDYHGYQRTWSRAEPYEREGIVVTELPIPVERAGLYVPGGRARYPSTVLMTAVPARVAGVPHVALCVPPDADGSVAEPTLAAAALAGVDEVYRVGGAQAVGAMAYGTETIGAVDVIVGPGNIYVSEAKRQVSGVVGVPSAFAGPSEVVVVADATTPVELAAIDVVVQAEHGPDGLAWLVTWSERVAEEVADAVARLVAASPRRSEIEATLAQGGYAVVVEGPEQAITVANSIAPEHLELLCDEPDGLLPLVRNAGAVFTGVFAPASVGDYLAGPSHVLPTYGSARFASALRVDDFVRHIHVVSVDERALARVAPHVRAIADAEGLPAHAESVRLRQPAREAGPKTWES